MDKEQILEILQKNRPLLRRFQVHSLFIFGSVARGDARQDSDVDILVEFEPDAAIGFFTFSRLQQSLSELVGRPVDLVTTDALHKALRQNILKEAIYAV